MVGNIFKTKGTIMYYNLGKYVGYKGKKHKIIGCSPAHKVDAGAGFAVLLKGVPDWINEDELDKNKGNGAL
jgi:hypothetical protein